MQKTLLSRTVLLCLVVVSAVTALGCYGPYMAGEVGVEVGGGPPGLRYEARIAAPGPDFIWVPGFWDWHGGNWGWVGGGWQHPPRAGARWIAPRYRHRGGRWNYYHGHWN